MKKRTITSFIFPIPVIFVIFTAYIFYALISISFNLRISFDEFIVKFYKPLNIFLFQVPLIIILIISSYKKYYNEMIIIRFKTQFKLYQAEITMASYISMIYVLLLILFEIVFAILTSRKIEHNLIISFSISSFIQLLTVFFIVSFYILLRKLSRSNTISTLIIIIILGIDTFTTIVRTPIIPYSINLFISPMQCFSEYIITLNSLGFHYYLLLSFLKIVTVIIITYIYILFARSEYVAKK
jgi:hypothetical protein